MFKKIKQWISNRRRVIKMTTIEAIKNDNVSLIDVRDVYELEMEGEIPNAINIPLGEISTRLEEIKALSKPLVIFCKSGKRSATAAQFLQANGVEEVFNGGGFKDISEILEDRVGDY